jgi:hypothetical protein
MERIPEEETSNPDVKDEDIPIPFKLQYTIETPHGNYVVRRPSGNVGATHFAILSRCLPTTYDTDGSPLISPRDEDRQYEAYIKWIPSVLKHILVSCPVVEGIQITFDTIPPEDQWSLFQAIGSLMKANKGAKPFRIVVE